jgi:hypothetical protein
MTKVLSRELGRKSITVNAVGIFLVGETTSPILHEGAETPAKNLLLLPAEGTWAWARQD